MRKDHSVTDSSARPRRDSPACLYILVGYRLDFGAVREQSCRLRRGGLGGRRSAAGWAARGRRRVQQPSEGQNDVDGAGARIEGSAALGGGDLLGRGRTPPPGGVPHTRSAGA